MRSLARLVALCLFVPALAAAHDPSKPVPHPEVTQVDKSLKGRLTAEEQKAHMKCPDGFAVELVAADPLVINPVTMVCDEKGRIYVSESHTYRYGPSGTPVKPASNPLVRLDPKPDGKGYTRTVVAEGFDDPVMGIAVKGDRLWAAANNYLFTFDLTPEGKAVNKKTLVTDKNKAWNPFGMFVLEWGPDGLLYLSVGDHNIHLVGPGGELKGRGRTGFVMRMNPDGTNMEYLVHGLRVPYSFEFDPFGQMWLLSNGEGNPNRFLRVIEGVDYHCYTRGVDNNWLAGNHPLAPPCFELPGGAHTQLMRYYGAAYPASFRGSLLLDNWGRHGFAGANRAVFRYVPDDAGQITAKEPFVWCTDPHFRPAHVCLDPEGNLLVADWYGRDDESDLTGRIWRIRYVGKDAPKPVAVPDAKALTVADAALGLGSPSHRVREVCTDFLFAAGAAKAVPALAEAAAKSAEPLGAANALWLLALLGTDDAKKALGAGAKHADAKVRRLAAQLVRRYKAANAAEVARSLGEDKSPAVLIAAALALPDEEARKALVSALARGAAHDPHTRYEAAWHLARLGGAFKELLASPDADTALAGMISVDVACYEKFTSQPDAVAALKAAVAAPGGCDPRSLLTLVQMHGDASFRPAVEAMLAKSDLPVAVVGRALLFLRAKASPSLKLEEKFAAKLAEAADAGKLAIDRPDDLVAVFALVEAGGPTPAALRLIGKQFGSNNREVRDAAHALARRFGPKSEPLAKDLWAVLADEKKAAQFGPEAVGTLARVEPKPDAERWAALLSAKDPGVRTEAVRAWRAFKGDSSRVDSLLRRAPKLLKADPDLAGDLAAVARTIGAPADKLKGLNLPAPPTRDELGRNAAELVAKVPPADRARRAALGQQVFDRAGCTKCHTTATQTTELAPSLKGIGGQKPEYLVESVLLPSKVIKTGFEAETFRTADDRVLTGLVRDDGDALRVLSANGVVRVQKADVAARSVTKISVMPEGLADGLSPREFADLVIYLSTLK